MNLRSALLASAMMALPLAAANAQAVDGLYVGGGLGVNFKQSVSAKATVGGVTGPSTNINSNVGPAVSLSLGWGFGNGLRAEIEGSYRYNSFKGAGAGTNEQLAGGMANVLYDFTMVPVVQPYVGVGVGYQRAFLGGAGPLSKESTGSFAYQAIVGAALPLSGVPGLALTADYRFMGLVGDRTFSGTSAGVPGSIKTTNDYNHTVLVGFRYAFNAAPAVAAPMPMADAGAKSFLVFFDWNKADLTARSQGIVRDAAAYSTKTQYTRIDVDGNADTSGKPGYNQGLSERRARIVAAELIRDGVPQNAISLHAYGDTKLLVPTGPEAREPQNRRVEIVFH